MQPVRTLLGRDLLGVAAGTHLVGAALLFASPPFVRHLLADLGYSPLIGPAIAGLVAGPGLMLVSRRAAGLGGVISTAILAAALVGHVQTDRLVSFGSLACISLVLVIWLGLSLADRRAREILLCEYEPSDADRP